MDVEKLKSFGNDQGRYHNSERDLIVYLHYRI